MAKTYGAISMEYFSIPSNYNAIFLKKNSKLHLQIKTYRVGFVNDKSGKDTPETPLEPAVAGFCQKGQLWYFQS